MKTAKTKAPKRTYKVNEWLDRSKPNYKIRYGIDIKIANGKWMHCCNGTEPLFFDTIEEAWAAKREFMKQDKACPSNAKAMRGGADA